MGLVGLIMLVIVIFVAVFAPILSPYDPSSTQDVTTSDIYNPPSAAHWLGTDDAGQDVLTNFIFGARVSLTIGFFAAFISLVIGALDVVVLPADSRLSMIRSCALPTSCWLSLTCRS